LRLSAVAPLLVLTAPLAGAQPLALDFDAGLAAGRVQPLVAEQIQLVPGRTGQAAALTRGTALAYPAPAFFRDGFDLRLWVKHDRALPDLRFEELVYFYHETPNERNRIMLQKRLGTDYLLFALTDGTGKAKGAAFAGNWFALKTEPLTWAAGTWHELRAVASRAAGRAALFVDGEKVAEASGTEFPQEVADRFWLGSLQGRSQLLGALDDVSLAPAPEAF
jgi:hypothetical protein